ARGPGSRAYGAPPEAGGLGRPPVPEQQEQRTERDQGADDVGQVGPEPLGRRELADDIGQGADDGQRPDAAQAAPPRDEVDEDPRRQQGEYGHDPADRGGQAEQRHVGDGGQRDDRGTQGALGDRRGVADG